MISERYAVAPRALGARRAGISSWRTRWAGRPTTAGWQQIAERVGQSVLVQLGLAVAFLALAGLLYMAQQSQVSVQQMNIAVLRSERIEYVADNTSLRSDATSLSQPSRIDAVATTTLHMAPPDLSHAVWVSPIVLPVQPLPSSDADRQTAQQASQPLAWMARAIHAVQSSL